MALPRRTIRRRARRHRARFNLAPQPKYQVGDQTGEFNIIECLGYSRIKPTGDPKILSQEHHWYKVRCSCGEEETHTQQQLIDTRRTRKCKKCLSTLGTKVPGHPPSIWRYN